MTSEIRCRNLHAAAQLGAPIVAYSGLVCRILGGDAAAAALLCQLWYLTREGARPTDETAEQLEESTGLSAKVQRRSRRVLAGRGWISELRGRRGGRTRIFTRVNAPVVLADLDAAGRERPAEQRDLPGAQRAGDRVPNGQAEQPPPPAQRAPSKNSDQDQEQEEEAADAARPLTAPCPISKQDGKQPKPTEAEILSGALDDSPAAGSLAVCAVICAAMDRDWHAGQRKVVPGKRNQALLADHVRAGGRVSDVLKAVHGMRHDDWQDRGRFAELRHVFGKLSEWVRLYNERHARGERPLWPRHQTRAPDGFRPWRDGVALPADREPTRGDQLALEAGYVFVFDARQWVDPLDDPGALLEAHRRRYGDANVTLTARARADAAGVKRARG